MRHLLPLITGLLLLVPAARADTAVLRNGQRLHITGYQQLGDRVRLDLPGGSVLLPANELASVQPEEFFPPNTPLKLTVPYAEQIREAAATYGVDPRLIASVIAVESGFDARAVSRKAARGLMQLRPRTAAELAVGNAFDPRQNIRAGTRYLKELLDRYGHNLALALAAYDAGPQAVDEYGGMPPFPETVRYVQRVRQKLRGYGVSGAVAASLPAFR